MRRRRRRRPPWMRLAVLAGLALLALALRLDCLERSDRRSLPVRLSPPSRRAADPAVLERLEDLRGTRVNVVRARVVEVIDGDTVRLEDGRRVRYLGLDAPERGQPLDGESAELNRALVSGREVLLWYDPARPTDGYGRLLAAVFASPIEQEASPDLQGTVAGAPVLVNAEILRQGLAHVYLKKRDTVTEAILGSILSAQGSAIDGRRGLWSVEGAVVGKSPDPVLASRFRFHRAGCRHVQDSFVPMERELALRSGRSPCRTCRP